MYVCTKPTDVESFGVCHSYYYTYIYGLCLYMGREETVKSVGLHAEKRIALAMVHYSPIRYLKSGSSGYRVSVESVSLVLIGYFDHGYGFSEDNTFCSIPAFSRNYGISLLCRNMI